MSVAHEPRTLKTSALKTTPQHPVLAAKIKGRQAPTPLEDHWFDSSAERFAKMVISPEMAASILSERNLRNRPVSRALVERLVRALTEGRWMFNGETIIFDWDGVLANGQHRLTACVETGIPIVSLVAFGMDPACFPTIDRNRSRKTADDLSILKEKNTSALSATIAMVWREEQGDIRRLSIQPTSEEAQDVLVRHPGIRDAVNWVVAKNVVRVIHPRLAGYCFFRFAELDADAAMTFFQDLQSGAGLQRGDPVLLLRNRLLDNKGAKSQLKVDEVLALTIKAWNGRRAGRPVFVLSWKEARADGTKGEPFPTIA